MSRAQAARAAAGTARPVQRQQRLVGPVQLSLGRMAVYYLSDEEQMGKKQGEVRICAQSTKDTTVLQLLEVHISQLHSKPAQYVHGAHCKLQNWLKQAIKQPLVACFHAEPWATAAALPEALK